jgi:hypothetical protein
MAQNSVKALTLSTFSSTTMTGTYQSMNYPGLLSPCFFIRIVNASSQAITVSFDGVNDHEYILEDSIFELATQTNAQPNSQQALMSAFTQVYVKGTAGTGNITLSGYYV